MQFLLELTNLESNYFALVCMVVFTAGVVRGFSGFALSALVMASLASIIAPLELIVVCFFLEMSASILMLKSGWKQGDVSLALKLAAGSVVGLFIGLAYTHAIPTIVSKFSALALILSLAILQICKVKFKFGKSNVGIYTSGMLAGVASGLASVGGLVVALFILAKEIKPEKMRASLVLFLFFTSFTAIANFLWYEMFTQITISRGLIFACPCFAGVYLGKLLFKPKAQKYYRPFCLLLLIFLAGLGIARISPELIYLIY